MSASKLLRSIQMLTIKEVAEELKVNKATIFRLIKAEKIKGVKIGKVWRINELEVEKIKSNGI